MCIVIFSRTDSDGLWGRLRTLFTLFMLSCTIILWLIVLDTQLEFVVGQKWIEKLESRLNFKFPCVQTTYSTTAIYVVSIAIVLIGALGVYGILMEKSIFLKPYLRYRCLWLVLSLIGAACALGYSMIIEGSIKFFFTSFLRLTLAWIAIELVCYLVVRSEVTQIENLERLASVFDSQKARRRVNNV